MKSFKEHYLLTVGIVVGLSILYCATWYVCSACSDILYGWVLFALLSTTIISGYGSFKFKVFDIEISIEKAKEIKQDIDHSFALFIPLIISIAYENDPSNKQIFNRLGSRKYIYDLMTKVSLNSTYDESTKIDLIERCKWYLIKELFESLKHSEIIQGQSKNDQLNYKPAYQDGVVNRLEEKIINLYKLIKNGIPDIEFDDWLQVLEQLHEDDLLINMDKASKKDYLHVIGKHKRELDRLIKKDKLTENFIIRGVL